MPTQTRIKREIIHSNPFGWLNSSEQNSSLRLFDKLQCIRIVRSEMLEHDKVAMRTEVDDGNPFLCGLLCDKHPNLA